MPTKKTTKKGPTTAQAFYVESNLDKTDRELAEATGMTAAQVKKYRKGLADAGFEPKPPAPEKSGVEKAGFGERDGVVVMTQSASEKGDLPLDPDKRAAALEKAEEERQRFFKTRIKGGIHVINPKRPVR